MGGVVERNQSGLFRSSANSRAVRLPSAASNTRRFHAWIIDRPTLLTPTPCQRLKVVAPSLSIVLTSAGDWLKTYHDARVATRMPAGDQRRTESYPRARRWSAVAVEPVTHTHRRSVMSDMCRNRYAGLSANRPSGVPNAIS